MKVLLLSINAKYIHTNNAVRLLKANSTFNPEILEYTIKDDINEMVKEINDKNVDVIACSVYIWNVNIFKSLMSKLDLKDKTLILVTHRPSVLSLVDRLIVMDDGKIIADGPKEEVLKALSNKAK